MRSEIITELFHFLIIDALQRDVRNLMETNQIETAVETLHQLDDCLGVLHTVVHSLEHDIFERQATLVREIIIAEQFHNLFYTHTLLGWHQFCSLRRYRIVHRDSHMALALFEESLQLVFDAHRTYCDTFRTPCPAIVSGQDFRGTQHIIQVVHRLALSHKHNIGEFVHLWQGVDLIEDIASRQTSFKPLLTSLTEEAVHLASHL